MDDVENICDEPIGIALVCGSALVFGPANAGMSSRKAAPPGISRSSALSIMENLKVSDAQVADGASVAVANSYRDIYQIDAGFEANFVS